MVEDKVIEGLRIAVTGILQGSRLDYINVRRLQYEDDARQKADRESMSCKSLDRTVKALAARAVCLECTCILS